MTTCCTSGPKKSGQVKRIVAERHASRIKSDHTERTIDYVFFLGWIDLGIIHLLNRVIGCIEERPISTKRA